MRQSLSVIRRYLKTKYLCHRLDAQKTRLDNLRADGNWLLIVLDACRYDRFFRLHGEFVEGTVERVASTGHNTFEYVRLNWPDTYDFPYVTGAAPINSTNFDFSNDSITAYGIGHADEAIEKVYKGYVPADHLLDIIEVWRDYWNEDLGVCPPEPVTDTALDIAEDATQMVVHYFQPHAPYIGEHQLLGDLTYVDGDETLRGGAIDYGIWDAVRSGEISKSELLRLYDSNLRRALKEASRLINNAEFDRVVITGDHGEALGEHDCYSHTYPMHPKVREVPWMEVKSVDEQRLRRYTPADYSAEEGRGDVSQRLEDLGYI